MYHFFFILNSKIFPNFNKIEKIDPEKEQIIDFCPKCNEKLPDKRVITLMEHDRKKHPKSEKEQVLDFYRKGNVRLSMIMIGIFLFSGIYLGIGQLNNLNWEQNLIGEEFEAFEFCKNLMDEYPDLELPIIGDVDKSKTARHNYILDNMDDFHKCGYELNVISIGDKEERLQHYLDSEESP